MNNFNIVQYLSNRNYLVKINATKNGCVANFPAQCLALYTGQVYSVEFVVDWQHGIVTINSPDTHQIHQPPAYLISTFILHCISVICSKSLYDPELIRFEIDGGIVDENYWLEYCFGDHMSTEDYVKSTSLLKIMLQAQNNGWIDEDENLAQESNVLDGYKFMKNILKMQDILNA